MQTNDEGWAATQANLADVITWMIDFTSGDTLFIIKCLTSQITQKAIFDEHTKESVEIIENFVIQPGVLVPATLQHSLGYQLINISLHTSQQMWIYDVLTPWLSTLTFDALRLVQLL